VNHICSLQWTRKMAGILWVKCQSVELFPFMRLSCVERMYVLPIHY